MPIPASIASSSVSGSPEDERRLHHVVVSLEHLEHAEQRPVQLFGGGERLRDVDERLGASELRDAIAPQQDAGGRGRHVVTVGGEARDPRMDPTAAVGAPADNSVVSDFG